MSSIDNDVPWMRNFGNGVDSSRVTFRGAIGGANKAPFKKKGRDEEGRIICFRCKTVGHMARDCPIAKERTLAAMDRENAMDEASLIASLIIDVPEDIGNSKRF